MIAEPPRPNPAPAPNSGRVDALVRLAALRDRGTTTNDEAQAEKTRIMTNGT